MIVCDVLRALVAALMALPGMPLFWLCALLVVLTVAGGPFRAAQLALLPTVLFGTRRDNALELATLCLGAATAALLRSDPVLVC